jgi:calcium permeable stress-gated cation channel
LPDVLSSFFWVPSVFSVSWSQVRRIAGLDGYFFLRFIRMNVRICSVTMFWAFIILVPLYATGDYQNNEVGWYHISVANVAKGSWRMWIPSCFAYLMSGFIFFVIKQEYRHYLELRMDFLARGTEKVHPQHHYSLKVENIPYELRSEKALYDYFDKLFPGKIHSATVVLNLPDLEAVKARCLRVCRRLEKSIAYCHATGKRATHNVGSPRISVLGVDLAPFDWSCGSYPE